MIATWILRFDTTGSILRENAIQSSKALAKRQRKWTQVVASSTSVQTCVGWPNGHARLVASSRKYAKSYFKC